MICNYFSEPLYIFFTTDLPPLLYYSHIPASVVALIVAAFLFAHNRKALLNQLFLLITLCFLGWTTINLYVWTNIHSEYMIFVWPFFGVLAAFISVFSIYFINVFVTKKDVNLSTKVIFLVLLAPVLLFAHTDLSVSGFNISECDAFGFEGFWFNLYYTWLGVLAMLWTTVLLVKQYKREENVEEKKQILLMGIGIEFFLFSFFTMTYISSYMSNLGLLEDSSLEFYGLFGMIVFMIFISILIVRFRAFNVGASASVALVVALIVLVGSQFTYIESATGVTLTSFTLIITGLIGILLLRSVRKEIKQREELEQLTTQLENANERLQKLDKLKSEFVSIASHQLRSPLTSIRGYASMLLDENYGKVPKKAAEVIGRIAESAKHMAFSIEDYLNVSRIESGNMKYNYTDFNLKDEVEKICDDLRPQAIKQGLGLIFRSENNGKGIVHADIGKVIQIIQNLINNATKYTPSGKIKVLVRDDTTKGKIYVEVEDTGIGIPKEYVENLFGKFERASNANSTNINGTGLGLYVSRQMAVAMGGEIKAFSEGEGKGSRFTLELPLAL